MIASNASSNQPIHFFRPRTVNIMSPQPRFDMPDGNLTVKGGKRRSAEVIADNVYFGDSRPKNGGETVPAFNGTPGEDAEYAVPPSGFAPDFGEEDGGLPF